MRRLLLVLCVFSALTASAGDKIICKTPPMGWISWNLFEGNINETLVKEIADAMVNSGLRDAGYEYIILDDLWQGGRDKNGKVFPDPAKFPSGMKALGDYIHSKGLKFGIYSDVAEATCGGAVGSLGFEEQDAQTYAEWGVDYVKCDYCGAPEDIWTANERYAKFIKALRKEIPDLVFALCEWGGRSPWLWGEKVGANLWRTTWDLRDTWESGKYDSGHMGIMEALDRQVGLDKYAGPGHWNDPDILMIGLYGKGKSSSYDGAAGCSVTEYESQMGLWSLLSAPLLMCNDIRKMDPETERILKNKELIAVNQDILGQQAKRIYKREAKEIWAKKLHDGSFAVGFLNRDDDEEKEITLKLQDLKVQNARARDLWRNQDLGNFSGAVTVRVKPHECKVLKISAN